MVIHALIIRTSDGLPFSASTEHDQGADNKESKRLLKVLSRKISQFSDRCTLDTGFHFIHFISSLNLSFLALCKKDYPVVLAFCFLDEIRKEFITTFTLEKIMTFIRPYGCIEFDVFLQKTKLRYSSPRSLATRLNLSDMSTEIKLRPPLLLTKNDVEDIYPNFHNSHLYMPTAGPLHRLMPLSRFGLVSLIVNIFCGVISMVRGITFINHATTLDWPDSLEAYQHGMIFLFSTAIILFQIYLLMYFLWKRTFLTCLSLAISCLCSIYVKNLQETWQIIFHLAANIFITVNIILRKLMPKQKDYNV